MRVCLPQATPLAAFQHQHPTTQPCKNRVRRIYFDICVSTISQHQPTHIFRFARAHARFLRVIEPWPTSPSAHLLPERCSAWHRSLRLYGKSSPRHSSISTTFATIYHLIIALEKRTTSITSTQPSPGRPQHRQRRQFHRRVCGFEEVEASH